VWNDGETPPDAALSWNALSDQQRTALTALGYDADTWTYSNEEAEGTAWISIIVAVVALACVCVCGFAVYKSRRSAGAPPQGTVHQPGTVNRTAAGAAPGQPPAAPVMAVAVPSAGGGALPQAVPYAQAVAYPIPAAEQQSLPVATAAVAVPVPVGAAPTTAADFLRKV
jgi:hypothetical protein